MIAARTLMKWVVCRANPGNSSKGPMAYYCNHTVSLGGQMIIDRTHERSEAFVFTWYECAEATARTPNLYGPTWESEGLNRWGVLPATIEVPAPGPTLNEPIPATPDTRPARVWRVSHDGADQWHTHWGDAREALFAGPPTATMRGIDLPQNGMQLIDLLQHERERIEAEIEERRAGEAAPSAEPAPADLPTCGRIDASKLTAWGVDWGAFADIGEFQADILRAARSAIEAPAAEPEPATPEEDPEETYLRLAACGLDHGVDGAARTPKPDPEEDPEPNPEADMVVAGIRYCGLRDLPKSKLVAVLKELGIHGPETSRRLRLSRLRD